MIISIYETYSVSHLDRLCQERYVQLTKLFFDHSAKIAEQYYAKHSGLINGIQMAEYLHNFRSREVQPEEKEEEEEDDDDDDYDYDYDNDDELFKNIELSEEAELSEDDKVHNNYYIKYYCIH